MIGDKIIIKPVYYETSRKIVEELRLKEYIQKQAKAVICIGGESGSGKSVTAVCLQEELQKQNINTIILHQDDYFFYPPAENHQLREKDINHIGPKEVNISSLQNHIDLFKRNEKSAVGPLMDYAMNTVSNQLLEFEHHSVLIVEGTYSMLLQGADFKIFIDRDYHKTLKNRIERNREKHSEFIEAVLEIEHQIIRQHSRFADYIIDHHYQLTKHHFNVK